MGRQGGEQPWIYYRKLLDYFRGMQYTTEKYSSR